MSFTTLPAVASRTYVDCKKCGCERYHIVVAHANPTTAKLECEVCHTKRSFRLGSTKAKAKSAKAKSAKLKAGATSAKWDEVKGLIDDAAKRAYNMRESFVLHATVEHPKFGVGVVTAIGHRSMEVVFPDGVRSLVQGRG